MKGTQHKELRDLVKRYESHQHMRAMQMNGLAIIGLIGFGLFAIPIFTGHTQSEIVAEVPTASQEKPAKPFPVVSLQAREVLVYDLTTHEALYEQRADEIRPLASLTKLLTVYAGLTKLPTESHITITESDVAPEGESGLAVGETYSLDSLARLALVSSSNDAAQTITEAVAEREQKNDSQLLANVASALGLLKTRAQNGTGLDISTNESGAYGSAYDVATLAGAIVGKDPELARATTRSTVSIRSLEGKVVTGDNTNHFIGTIPSPLLSKTGYTDLAGGNLVVVFDAGIAHPVAVVVLGSTRESRFTDVEQLVQATLAYFAPERSSP